MSTSGGGGRHYCTFLETCPPNLYMLTAMGVRESMISCQVWLSILASACSQLLPSCFAGLAFFLPAHSEKCQHRPVTVVQEFQCLSIHHYIPIKACRPVLALATWSEVCRPHFMWPKYCLVGEQDHCQLVLSLLCSQFLCRHVILELVQRTASASMGAAILF